MKHTYHATEYSQDVRNFEIISDVELTEEDIHDALVLPDITTEGDVVTEGGLQVTFIGTDYGDDSQVEFYLEKPEHTMKLIEGGADAEES